MEQYQIIKLDSDFTIKVQQTAKRKKYPAEIESQVDAIWEQQKLIYGDHLYNGQILSEIEYTEHELIGELVEYRYHVAQIHAPELLPYLKVHTVSVTGITYSGDDVLIGQRSSKVAEYRDMYELAPSGGIDPAAIEGDRVDLLKQVGIELHEETGLDSEAIVHIEPMALAIHLTKKSFEFCIKIDIDPTKKDLMKIHNEEYQKLMWIHKDEVRAFADSHLNTFVSLSTQLISNLF